MSGNGLLAWVSTADMRNAAPLPVLAGGPVVVLTGAAGGGAAGPP